MTPTEALEQVRALHAEHRWSTEGNSRFREGMVAILDAVTPDAPVTVETLADVLPGIELTREFDVTYDDATIIGEYLAGLGYVLTPATPERTEQVEARCQHGTPLSDLCQHAEMCANTHPVGTEPVPVSTEQGRAALDDALNDLLGATFNPSVIDHIVQEVHERVVAAYEGREVSE